MNFSEKNVIINQSYFSWKELDVCIPCPICQRMIVNSGIEKVVSRKGIIWEKGIIDDNYFLSVKNDQGEIIVIKLLKNNCGSLIYNFASWGSDVLKKKGERNLHIRVKYVDGSLHGRIFTNFCE